MNQNKITKQPQLDLTHCRIMSVAMQDLPSRQKAADTEYDMAESGAEDDCCHTQDRPLTQQDFDKLLDDFIAGEMASSNDTPEEEQPDSGQFKDEPFDHEISRLVGLDEVKHKLVAYEKLMRFNALRAQAGLYVTATPLHAMFLGSPGTGKTTVAKMMGRMLHRLGLLSEGHVVVRERASLSGIHYGDHETLTRQALEEARGGILFIDEAYQLYQPDDPKDPGRIVIETLLTALADEADRDWMLILAGYPQEMLRMFEMNPGLRSRIPDTNLYTFADFSESELMEIADRWFADHDFTLTPAARKALSLRLGDDYAHRDRHFGNARHVVNLIQADVLPAMAARVMESEQPASLTDILPVDIPAPVLSLQPVRRRIGFCA